jgi:uncharacterized protein (DUF2062 family)
MPRTFLKKIMPNHEKLKQNKIFQFFGPTLLHPQLWGINRRNVALAVGIGIFVGMIPIPMQMGVVAIIALFFHFNLPIAVSMVWISNPITMPPLFYSEYYVGSLILGTEIDNSLEFSTEWILDNLGTIGYSMYFGALLYGIVFGLLGYFSVHLLWWYSLRKKQQEKKRG